MTTDAGDTPTRVLIVEDNRDVADSIDDFLSARGWRVETARDAESGLRCLEAGDYDVLIVDVMLPGGMDGLELCRRLRRAPAAAPPILMLTALDTLDDTLAGFEAGVDDYLKKPFSLHELLARLRALLQRTGRQQARLEVGPLVLDIGTQRATREGVELELSESSIKLLAELMRCSPNVVGHERLSRILWPSKAPSSDSLKTHLYYLRRELDRPFASPMLHTVRGRGYRLTAP